MYRLSWPQTLAAFAAALLLMVALLAVVFLPHPTVFQVTIIRTICALCSAAFVSIVPGFLELKLEGPSSKLIRAGGSLAVFLIVYMLFPTFVGSSP